MSEFTYRLALMFLGGHQLKKTPCMIVMTMKMLQRPIEACYCKSQKLLSSDLTILVDLEALFKICVYIDIIN